MKEGQTQEPVGGMEDDIAKILADNIYFSGQVCGFVVHGAIEKIIEYFTPPPAPIKTEGEDEKTFRFVKAKNKLSGHMQKVCCRKVGYTDTWVTGYYDGSRKVYMLANMGPSGFKPEEIEWQEDISAPPSPVGIDVEAFMKILESQSFDDKSEKILKEGFAKFLAGYSASLPQSSTEEEKDLWFDVKEVFMSHYDVYGYPAHAIEELLSKFKISKR